MSAISSAVLLLWGATSGLATTQITGRAREIFWEKTQTQLKIVYLKSKQYMYTMGHIYIAGNT